VIILSLSVRKFRSKEIDTLDWSRLTIQRQCSRETTDDGQSILCNVESLSEMKVKTCG
jgi:hypothetical protein